jgi:TonB family protein
MSVGTLCAFALLSFIFTVSVFAQSTEWKKYTSEKGKFSVLLPGAPETDYRLGDPDSVTGLVYAINYYQKEAKAWSVDYFDLPVIPPDADTVRKLLERRVDRYFTGKGSTALTLNGCPALEYKMSIDRDGIEIVRIILVKQRVYQMRVVMLTQAKHATSEVTKFFDSFKPVPMTNEEIVEVTRTAREKIVSRDLVVSGRVLQARAVKKVQPVYPPEARAARVAGAVKIRILVSEEGNVIEAEVLEGLDLLRESALAAARLWVFMPTELAGKPVKVQGVVTLMFAPMSLTKKSQYKRKSL